MDILQILENLQFKDELDIDTSDGYELSTWMSNTPYLGDFMIIQIDKGDKTIFHRSDIQSEYEFKEAIQKAIAKIQSISSGRKYNMKSTHRIYESVRTAKSTTSGSYKQCCWIRLFWGFCIYRKGS